MDSNSNRKRRRIGKIIAVMFFIPGAILARIGWAMNQALMEKGTNTSLGGDGFIEMIVFFCGFFLILISLILLLVLLD